MRFLCFTSSSSSSSSSCPPYNLGWYAVMVGIYIAVRCLALVVNAQVPADNDLCINAVTVIIGTSSVSTKYNTTEATIDADVFDDCLASHQPPTNKGIWFTLTGNGKRMVARACHDETYYEYSPPSTIISIFTGGCISESRQCVAATKCGCTDERFFFNTTIGTTYHILVQNPKTFRGETVDVSIFEAPPRGNDLCENAQPIGIGSSLTLDMNYSTKDNFEVDNCSTKGLKGVWLNFTGTGDVIEISKNTEFFPGVTFIVPTRIAVYTGRCASLSTMQFVATSTSEYIGSKIVDTPVIFETMIGTAYHILVQSLTIREVTITTMKVPYSNDFCKNAQQVAIGPRVDISSYDTRYATKDLEVTDNCIDGKPPNTKGIWFNFTGTGRGIVTKAENVCLIISVYTGGCDPFGRQCVAGTTINLYAEGGQFMFNSLVDVVYHALVRVCDGGAFQNSISVSIFEAPRIVIDIEPSMTPVTGNPTMALVPTSMAPQLPADRPSCGLFGLRFFCPRPGECGFIRRLFGINGC